MKRAIILLSWLCFVFGQAQIASGEYFFDTDPGVGNGTVLAVSGNVIDQDLNIPTTGLSEGIHKLYVRLINNDGTWSLYDKNVFYVSANTENTANIASAEYFMDTDPGVGNGTALAVSGNVIDQDLNIPTTGLSDGVHKLYIRLINDDGSWSLYDKNVFYASPNNTNTANIASAEYFMDTDPGVGNGTALTVSGNVIDQDLNIPTTGLSDGIHKLYIRLINDDGSWSLYDKNVFYASPNNTNTANIASAEYFIDTDPGVGDGTALTVSGNVIDQGFNISTTGLSDGVHKLYIRLINDNGSWSLYDKNVFYTSPDNSNTALITAAEYFFDIDPGIGNASPIDLTDATNFDSDFDIQVPNDLPDGDHVLYIRVLNTDGTWSIYAQSEILPSLDTDEHSFNNTFKLYPNPVVDVLNVNTNKETIRALKIIDLTGKVVYDLKPENFRIDLSSLNPGTYLLQLKTDLGSVSRKIIKQ
ncbi:T9SS type A sorting domain-containing protein [Seonamhaeicola sp.]|uniref:T9SS type A sorting domain-containing protein n=1 Tax=Seonamhaeicola sp. TaxID=1912245 RepID=UPI002630AF6F|nr:T9SS type A sorting domain-containing protein [Seonamhaeicola sp.]